MTIQPTVSIEDAIPVGIKPGGSNIGATFIVGGAKWYGKINLPTERCELSKQYDSDQLVEAICLAAILEFVAFDLFKVLSAGNAFTVAEAMLANLSIWNKFSRGSEIVLESLEKAEGKCLWVLSRFIEGYQDLGHARTILPGTGCVVSVLEYIQNTHGVPESILDEDENLVPVHGLVELLAVIKALGDIDGFGACGNNVGFIWKRNSYGEVICANAVKIDPGDAFRFKPDCGAQILDDPKDIQLSINGALAVHWTALSDAQKLNFVCVMNSCVTFFKNFSAHDQCVLWHIIQSEGSLDQVNSLKMPVSVAEKLLGDLRDWLESQKRVYDIQNTYHCLSSVPFPSKSIFPVNEASPKNSPTTPSHPFLNNWWNEPAFIPVSCKCTSQGLTYEPQNNLDPESLRSIDQPQTFLNFPSCFQIPEFHHGISDVGPFFEITGSPHEGSFPGVATIPAVELSQGCGSDVVPSFCEPSLTSTPAQVQNPPLTLVYPIPDFDLLASWPSSVPNQSFFVDSQQSKDFTDNFYCEVDDLLVESLSFQTHPSPFTCEYDVYNGRSPDLSLFLESSLVWFSEEEARGERVWKLGDQFVNEWSNQTQLGVLIYGTDFLRDVIIHISDKFMIVVNNLSDTEQEYLMNVLQQLHSKIEISNTCNRCHFVFVFHNFRCANMTECQQLWKLRVRDVFAQVGTVQTSEVFFPGDPAPWFQVAIPGSAFTVCLVDDDLGPEVKHYYCCVAHFLKFQKYQPANPFNWMNTICSDQSEKDKENLSPVENCQQHFQSCATSLWKCSKFQKFEPLGECHSLFLNSPNGLVMKCSLLLNDLELNLGENTSETPHRFAMKMIRNLRFQYSKGLEIDSTRIDIFVQHQLLTLIRNTPNLEKRSKLLTLKSLFSLHPNINAMISSFYEKPTEQTLSFICESVPDLGINPDTPPKKTPFFLLERHPTNLKDLLAQGGNELQNVKYATHLARVLVFLSEIKIAHSDIKLDNILCSENGSLGKDFPVVDFGSAKIKKKDCDLNENILLFGTIAAGKSTILNSLVGMLKFESGVSFGPMTTQTSVYKVEHLGATFIDTPGILDARRASNFELFPYFREGKLSQSAPYKLIFMTVLNGNKVLGEQSVNMLKQFHLEIRSLESNYAIIVNKVDPSLNIEQLRVDILAQLTGVVPVPACIFFNLLDSRLAGQANVLVEPSPGLTRFIEVCPATCLDFDRINYEEEPNPHDLQSTLSLQNEIISQRDTYANDFVDRVSQNKNLSPLQKSMLKQTVLSALQNAILQQGCFTAQ